MTSAMAMAFRIPSSNVVNSWLLPVSRSRNLHEECPLSPLGAPGVVTHAYAAPRNEMTHSRLLSPAPSLRARKFVANETNEVPLCAILPHGASQ
jgi:hypothetical protein